MSKCVIWNKISPRKTGEGTFSVLPYVFSRRHNTLRVHVAREALGTNISCLELFSPRSTINKNNSGELRTRRRKKKRFNNHHSVSVEKKMSPRREWNSRCREGYGFLSHTGNMLNISSFRILTNFCQLFFLCRTIVKRVSPAFNQPNLAYSLRHLDELFCWSCSLERLSTGGCEKGHQNACLFRNFWDVVCLVKLWVCKFLAFAYASLLSSVRRNKGR